MERSGLETWPAYCITFMGETFYFHDFSLSPLRGITEYWPDDRLREGREGAEWGGGDKLCNRLASYAGRSSCNPPSHFKLRKLGKATDEWAICLEYRFCLLSLFHKGTKRIERRI